jgi:hypothetical protein
MATKTVIKQKMTTYVGGFVLRLGPISTTGKLVSVTVSKSKSAPSFKLTTPDGLPVEQMYRDPNGKLYLPGELCKAATTDEGAVIVDKAGLDAAKASLLPQNVLSATTPTSSSPIRMIRRTASGTTSSWAC